MKINLKDFSVVDEDGFKYRQTRMFFSLYVCLGWARLVEGDKGGFVETDTIHHLPWWEKNKLQSIGKQIRRHMIEMEAKGKNVIESRQKIKGPFRLNIGPKDISFDVELKKVRDFLGIDRLAVFYTKGKEDIFYDYVDEMVQGDLIFNKGFLSDALTSFNQALEKSLTVEQEVNALQRIGRAYQQLGQYDEARKKFLKAISKIQGGANYYDLANSYVSLAWLYHRQNKYSLSEKTYYHAWDLIRERNYPLIMGGIYDGLGIVSEAKKQYDEALGFYKNAMGIWCLVSNFYGVAATYFNIGNVYKKRADEIVKKKKQINTEAWKSIKGDFKRGIIWAKKCNDLSERAGVGYETSQASIVIAYCYYMIGDFPEALRYAKEAEEVATKADNDRDIALSSRVLGKVLFKIGEKEEAKKFIDRSLEFYGKIQDKQQIKKISAEINLSFKFLEPQS